MYDSDENAPSDIPITFETLVNVCGDEDMVDSVVEVFEEESAYTLDMIKKAAEKQDAGELKLYCHRMKGSARYLGDEEFVKVCFDAEKAAEAGNIQEAVRLSKKIEPITAKYLAFFSRDDWKQLLIEKGQNLS